MWEQTKKTHIPWNNNLQRQDSTGKTQPVQLRFLTALPSTLPPQAENRVSKEQMYHVMSGWMASFQWLYGLSFGTELGERADCNLLSQFDGKDGRQVSF